MPCVHDFFNVFFKHTSLSAHSEPIAKHPRLTFVIHKSYLQLGTFLRTNQLGSIGRKVCYTYFDVYGIKVHPGTRNDQFKMDVWWFPTISFVKNWNHPIETTTNKWMFEVPGLDKYATKHGSCGGHKTSSDPKTSAVSQKSSATKKSRRNPRGIILQIPEEYPGVSVWVTVDGSEIRLPPAYHRPGHKTRPGWHEPLAGMKHEILIGL